MVAGLPAPTGDAGQHGAPTVRAAQVLDGPYGQARLSAGCSQNLPAWMAASVTRETW